MKVRRKSLWRSANNKTAMARANQRAAKERVRMARALRGELAPDLSHAPRLPESPPLFTVSIRCRDGARVSLKLHETPWGLTIAPSAVGRRIAAVLTHYRPA